MRIITLNVNGIRAAAKAGVFDWLDKQNYDIACLQEIRAQPEQLTDPIFYPANYESYYFPAEKKGYSGVALYTRHKPSNIIKGLGWDLCDKEGRYLEAEFGPLSVVSLYLPSGTSGPVRQACKYDFMDRFSKHLQNIKDSGRHYILCGDWNIAHTKEDLKNWRTNQKTSGFLPEERAWIDNLFKIGFIDAFRSINKEIDQYTWWSHRGQAFAKNVGWRIDYHITTPSLKEAVKSVAIYKEKRFSDHAPVIIDYEYEI